METVKLALIVPFASECVVRPVTAVRLASLLNRFLKITLCDQQLGETHRPGNEAIVRLASIPGRVFAFITVRRTTGPGTSCLRMRQIFIVYLCQV